MFEFVWGVLVGMFQVLLYGGVVIAWLKFYEWYDDKFIDMKKGNYLGKKKNVFYRIKVPAETYVPISQMESFFIDCSELNSFSSTSRIYLDGKWYFNIVFDIILRNGVIETFMRIEKSRSTAVLAHLKNNYPNLQVEETTDPYSDWPKEWWNKDGALGFKDFRGTDILPKKTDLFPLRSWKDFYKGNVLLDDPMSVLISYLKTMPKESIFVMQYILRPFDFKAPRARWEKELAALRKEFSTNAYVERKSSTVQSLTGYEKAILNSIQDKMGKKHYRVKLRWLVLYNAKDKLVDDGEVSRGVKSYLGKYKTEMQSLGAYDASDTDFTYKGMKYGPLDAPLGDFLNKLYYKTSEKEYRMRRLYAGIVCREIDFGADSNKFFVDTESLAALFHFPEVKFKTSLDTIYNNRTQNNPQNIDATGNVVIQQYQPAYYIAQDGSSASIQTDQDDSENSDDSTGVFAKPNNFQPYPANTQNQYYQPQNQPVPSPQAQSQAFSQAFPQQSVRYPPRPQQIPQYAQRPQPQMQYQQQPQTQNTPQVVYPPQPAPHDFKPPEDLPT